MFLCFLGCMVACVLRTACVACDGSFVFRLSDNLLVWSLYCMDIATGKLWHTKGNFWNPWPGAADFWHSYSFGCCFESMGRVGFAFATCFQGPPPTCTRTARKQDLYKGFATKTSPSWGVSLGPRQTAWNGEGWAGWYASGCSDLNVELWELDGNGQVHHIPPLSASQGYSLCTIKIHPRLLWSFLQRFSKHWQTPWRLVDVMLVCRHWWWFRDSLFFLGKTHLLCPCMANPSGSCWWACCYKARSGTDSCKLTWLAGTMAALRHGDTTLH